MCGVCVFVQCSEQTLSSQPGDVWPHLGDVKESRGGKDRGPRAKKKKILGTCEEKEWAVRGSPEDKKMCVGSPD